MRFHELNVLGVYISPIAPVLVGAWVVTVLLRRLAGRVGLLERIWHPALFVFAVYVIVVACAVLVQAG